MRITQKDLEGRVERINTLLNMANEPYRKTGKTQEAFYIDYANGGVALNKMLSSGGAIDIISRCSKKELYHRMQAFIAGVKTVNNK